MLRKKIVGLIGGLVAVLTIAAFSSGVLVTTVPVRVLGPWFTTPMPFDSTNINQVGGHVQFYNAADSVWVGQIVSFASVNKVKTVSTIDSTNRVAGVVVGGTRTSMQASIARGDSSTLAAIAGQRVIVMDFGRYWILDSAGAKIPGSLVRASLGGTRLARGRISLATANVIDTFYRVVGRLVDTSLGGTNALVQIHVK